MDADELHEEAKARMDVLDGLPKVVRMAIHEAGTYTDPKKALALTRRYGSEQAARMILTAKDD